MKFFQTIKSSIYSPIFYSGINKKSFKTAFGYFLLLILILTFINTLNLIKPVAIIFPAELQKGIVGVADCFPKNLEVNINNGQLATNQTEPYFISCTNLGLKPGENLVVIDTKTPFSAEKFAEYKTPVWVTKSSIISKKDSFETRSYSLTEVKNYKLNKQVADSYFQTIKPWFNFVGPILLIISFVGIYIAYLLKLIYLLILAVLIWVLSKVFKHTLSYSQSYKTGLYAITLGLIIELGVNLTGRFTHFYGFPFMFTIISLGVVTVNLFTTKKD